MSQRRTPKSGTSATKVFWSEAEKAQVIRAAVDMQRARPDLAGLPLLRAAMTALPADRRRRLVALSQVEWFERGVRDEIRRQADDFKADPGAKEFADAIGRLQALHESWLSEQRKLFERQQTMFAEIRDELRKQTNIFEDCHKPA